MKIGPLLAAMGGVGGLAATGNLGALQYASPMLAMLLHKKHPQQTPTGPEKGPPVVAPPAPAPAPAGVAPAQQGMDPARRQQLAQMLLQLGGGMNTPFGARY